MVPRTSVLAVTLAAASLAVLGCGWKGTRQTETGTRPVGSYFTAPMTLAGQEVSAETLNQGHESYTLYCRPCHGDEGDGHGPAAAGLRPPPRDFRQATFKFGWVTDGLPRDEDLARIVSNGLHGTAMLPWDIPKEEVPAILAYVKTFAPTEWADAAAIGQPVIPGADPWGASRRDEAVARGKELYHGKAQCWTCHPAYATQQYVAEVRNSPDFRDAMYLPEAKESSYTVGDHAVKLLPADFSWHELRSIRPGSELEDLFSLIGAGIPGTAMPQWKGALPDEDIWAIAYFVRSVMELKDQPGAVSLRDELRDQPALAWPPAGTEPTPGM